MSTSNFNENNSEFRDETTEAIYENEESILQVNSNRTAIVQEELSTYDLMLAAFQGRFPIGAKFNSIDHLREQAVVCGSENNVSIVTQRSSQERKTITLACQHSGEYRKAKSAGELIVTTATRKKATYKLGCPMHITASSDAFDNIIVRGACFEHNHGLIHDRRTYSVFRKLDNDTFELAVKLLEKFTPSKTLTVSHIYRI